MKNSMILVIFLLIPLTIHSQGVGLGIKAGANFADPSITGISVKTVTDFHVGAYLNLDFTKSFGIKPEIQYTAYGSKWNDIKVNWDYIAIPVMICVRPVRFLSIEAGPQFSILTTAKSSTLGDIKSQLKNNDFGLGFGAAVNLPAGFNVGARYVLGFMNISQVSGEDIKNRTFQIYLGWTYLGGDKD